MKTLKKQQVKGKKRIDIITDTLRNDEELNRNAHEHMSGIIPKEWIISTSILFQKKSKRKGES